MTNAKTSNPTSRISLSLTRLSSLMVNNFYTLQALTRAWATDLAGCLVGDVFSQVRGELTIALADPEREWMLRVSTQAPFYFVFRSAGYSKARRNVATLFEGAFDRRVEAVRTAERDRMLFLDLDDGSRFQIVLFGPRANVFWVDAGGTVVEAFQGDEQSKGQPAPTPRPVISISRARLSPMMRGRRMVPPSISGTPQRRQ